MIVLFYVSKEYVTNFTTTILLLLYPAGNYTFKVNNKNTRTRREICSKLTTKTPDNANGVVPVSL